MHVFVDACPRSVSKKQDAMSKLLECVEQYCLENRLYDDTCDITDSDCCFDLCERDFVRGICRTSSVNDIRYRLRYQDSADPSVSMESLLCSEILCGDDESDSYFSLNEKDFVRGICLASSMNELSANMNSSIFSDDRHFASKNDTVSMDSALYSVCSNDELVHNETGDNSQYSRMSECDTSMWSGIGATVFTRKSVMCESYEKNVSESVLECSVNDKSDVLVRSMESLNDSSLCESVFEYSENDMSDIMSDVEALNDSDESGCVKGSDVVDVVIQDVINAFMFD